MAVAIREAANSIFIDAPHIPITKHDQIRILRLEGQEHDVITPLNDA
jgi:hypothetical protein